jgi:hypothetical protein
MLSFFWEGVKERGEEAIQLVYSMRHPYVNIKAVEG